MNEYLTVEEVATSLRVSEKTIYRLLRQGRLPATRIGHVWRLNQASVSEWIHRGSIGLRVRVLVVDDEVEIGSLFERVLEQFGHEVTTAQTGFEGLELVQQRDFDLVFLDLKLPDTDGAEILRRIKGLRPELPVTIITGYPESELMSRALEQGPVQVIHKPFGKEEILAAVSYACHLPVKSLSAVSG